MKTDLTDQAEDASFVEATTDPEPRAEMHDEPESRSFGTFFVGSVELAFPTENVREVVPYPDSVSEVPLCNDAVHGIFSLRGEVLPIVDLADLLELERGGERCGGRVAVIEHGSSCIGVALDRTGEVLRVAQEGLHCVDHASRDGLGVIDGVIEIPDEDRFVQTLSSDVLQSISGVPRPRTQSAAQREEVDSRTYSKAIVFQVGTVELALQIHEVLEIQSGLEISNSPRYFDHCIGVVMLRGHTLPILDLRSALGLPHDEPPERYVFIEMDGEKVGLGVDALTETIEFAEDTLMPVPGFLSDGLLSICDQVIQPDADRHVLVASTRALFEHHGVGKLSDVLGYSSSSVEDKQVEEDEELGFFAFQVAQHTLCLPLAGVREVCEVGEDVFSAGEQAGDLLGLMNLRGEIVPLIDASERLNLHESASDSSPSQGRPIALVVESGDDTFGLVVDEIVDIKRTLSSSVSETTGAGTAGGMMEFVQSTLLAESVTGSSEVLVILDAERLVAAA